MRNRVRLPGLLGRLQKRLRYKEEVTAEEKRIGEKSLGQRIREEHFAGLGISRKKSQDIQCC